MVVGGPDNPRSQVAGDSATIVAVVLDMAPGDVSTPHAAERLAEALGAHYRVFVAGPEAVSSEIGVSRVETAHSTLASSRNVALEALTEPYVAFVGGAVAQTSEWLGAAVEVLRAHDTVSGVAVRVEGRPEPTMTLLGGPDDRRLTAGTTEVAFAWPEAMLLRTAHVRHIGGFGEHLGNVGACVELGWRLWLAGGSIRWMPGSPFNPSTPPCAFDTTERASDALATAFVCYDDPRMATATAAALVALPALIGTEAAAAAIDAFQRRLPALRERRLRVQATRRRPDHQLLGLSSSDSTRRALGQRWDNVVDGLDLDRLFGSRRRVLVVTTDVLATKMAGPAIRAWQIAEVLAGEHDVRLVTTAAQSRPPHSAEFVVEFADLLRMAELEQWCEIVVLQGYGLAQIPALQLSQKIMLVDIYDPLHLESLEMTKRDLEPQRSAEVLGTVDILSRQLARGDFFVCASEKQRDMWIGHLAALGRVNPANYDEDPTFRRLIDVAPFGLPAHDAQHLRSAIKGVVPGIEADDEVILWGGGIYNWLDPLTLIRAVDKLRHRRPHIRLYFLGGRHPNPEVAEMRTAVAAHVLASQLGLTNRFVFFNEEWVDYEDRQNYLAEASVGVSTHLDHAETAYSFRTRILDYLWAGLPVVATAGDAFADLIDREGLGLMVPAEDVDALELALERVLEDPGFAETCRANVVRVREQFTWATALRPVVDFCRSPRRAPDLASLPAPPPAPEVPEPSSGLRQDVRIVRHLYHQGGVRLVAGAAARRLRRRRPVPRLESVPSLRLPGRSPGR